MAQELCTLTVKISSLVQNYYQKGNIGGKRGRFGGEKEYMQPSGTLIVAGDTVSMEDSAWIRKDKKIF